MKQLFDVWDSIERKLKTAKHILLMFDYDGTLTPIVQKPESAKLPIRTKALIEKLSTKKYVTVGIISGRSLKDIKKLVGIKGIVYAGNHGLELEGPNLKFINPAAGLSQPLIQEIGRKLKEGLRHIEGAIVEMKGLSLSVHYRLVKDSDFLILKRIFASITRQFLLEKKIKVTFGKKVYEVRPPVKWNKGKIIKWILGRLYLKYEAKDVLPIYFGDDETDEDAFRELKKKGLTIFVGEERAPSKADYYVASGKKANDFLERILKLKGTFPKGTPYGV